MHLLFLLNTVLFVCLFVVVFLGFFFFLVTPHSMWDRTCTPCIGSAESLPLNRQGSPSLLFLINFIHTHVLTLPFFSIHVLCFWPFSSYFKPTKSKQIFKSWGQQDLSIEKGAFKKMSFTQPFETVLWEQEHMSSIVWIRVPLTM